MTTALDITLTALRAAAKWTRDPTRKTELLAAIRAAEAEDRRPRDVPWPDGSTRRHVSRARVQDVCLRIYHAYHEDDGLAALEALEALENQAEEAAVNEWLMVKQREWLRMERRLTCETES